MLVAIAIIGVLASSAFFVLNPGEQLAKSRDAQRKNSLNQAKIALDAYYNDNNRYPDQLTQIGESRISGLSVQGYCYEISADGSSYRLSVKLERSSDPQVVSGEIICSGTGGYNYAVTSTNTSVVAH